MIIKINNYSMEPARFVAGTKGSYGIETLDFEFGDEWRDLGKKVVFSTGDGRSVSVLYKGAPIAIPYEVMSCHGKAKFAVVGYREGVTLITVSGEIDVINTLSPEGEDAIAPTPSEMEQVIAQMNDTSKRIEDIEEGMEKLENSTGNNWHFGTEITGGGTVEANIEYSRAGDFYINSNTFELYRCVSENLWKYEGTLKGDDGEDGKEGKSYVLTAEDKRDIAVIVAELLGNGNGEEGEDEEESTTVTFTISEFSGDYGAHGTFTVDKEITWSEWLATNPFNDESIISFGDDGICLLPWSYYLYDSSDQKIDPSDVIVKGTYSFQDPFYVGKQRIVAQGLSNSTYTYSFWVEDGWSWADWVNANKDSEGASVYADNNAVLWHGASWYLCDANGAVIPATALIDKNTTYYYDTCYF